VARRMAAAKSIRRLAPLSVARAERQRSKMVARRKKKPGI